MYESTFIFNTGQAGTIYGFNHEPVLPLLYDLTMRLKNEVFDIKSCNIVPILCILSRRKNSITIDS